MAHFAQIDERGYVLQVLVVDDSQQHRGEEFLANDLGLGGSWIQTSYNGNFRKQYAGIGFWYDEFHDVFISPKPFPSWILDPITWDWEGPIERPNELCYWDEDTISWINYKFE